MIKIFSTGGEIDSSFSPHMNKLGLYDPQVPMLINSLKIDAQSEVISMIEDIWREGCPTMEWLEWVKVTVYKHQGPAIITCDTSLIDTVVEYLGDHPPRGHVTVVTGSRISPAILGSDAGFNLGFAIAIAQCHPGSALISAIDGKFRTSTHRPPSCPVVNESND